MISYYRYNGQSVIENINEIFKMCRRTGYRVNSELPERYPVDYFARFPLDPKFIMAAINCCKDDDIYNQLASFPLPEHRSAGLSQQASLIFPLLFQAPSILENERAKMREIVDKHFPDNWVIPIY